MIENPSCPLGRIYSLAFCVGTCVTMMFVHVSGCVKCVCAHLGACVLVCMEARGWREYPPQPFSSSETGFLMEPELIHFPGLAAQVVLESPSSQLAYR